MTPIFVDHCGFENPWQHKPHGKLALGITMLSNSISLEHVKMRSLRHLNLKMHERYQRLMDESIYKKNEAMNPSLCSCLPTKTPPPIEKKQPDSKDSSQQKTNASHKSPTLSTLTYHTPQQIVINICNPYVMTPYNHYLPPWNNASNVNLPVQNDPTNTVIPLCNKQD